MTLEESDRILCETSHIGNLRITIENVGTMAVHPFMVGFQSLGAIVTLVASMLGHETMSWAAENNTWFVVSYDQEKGVLVVRKK